jgi:hypothetical protein
MKSKYKRQEETRIFYEMMSNKRLLNNMTRCRGFDCTETKTCLRYQQLWHDTPEHAFPVMETGQHKDSHCIFKIEVNNELAA